MKRKVLSLVLATVMATSLVACGGTESASSSTAAPAETKTEAAAPAAEGSHTLTVAAWDENFNIPALKAAEKDFQEVDPEFTLEVILQSNSQDVEQAVTLAGGSGDYSTLADIVLFQDHYFQRFHNDYPDAWVAADGVDVDWNGLGAEKLSYSTIDGTHYGFPVDAGTAIFAYRTDILEECGYTLADVEGITWDRFIEIGKEVKAKTGKYMLCMDGSGNDLFYMMLQEEGVSQFKDGKPFFTGNSALEEIFHINAEMAKEDIIYLSTDWSDYTDTAIQGDLVAGVFNGNWIIPTIEKVPENSGKWALTAAPSLTGKPGYASNGGSSLYITANCQNTELAKQFLAYTFGGGSAADGQSTTYDEALLNGGVIGTCAAAAASDVYQQGRDFWNGQAIYADIVAMTQNVPVVEQSDYHYSARTVLGTHLQNVIAGAEDEASAIAAAEQELNFEMGN